MIVQFQDGSALVIEHVVSWGWLWPTEDLHIRMVDGSAWVVTPMMTPAPKEVVRLLTEALGAPLAREA